METKLELKHHKDFHKIQFQSLTTIQRNLTFALCYKLMNQESNLLEFDAKEIIEMTGYRPLKKGDNIYKHLERTYDILKNITIKIDKKNGVKKFVLFTVFETFEDTGKVKIKVNSEYRYLLNQVTAPFTLQNLLEYSELKSNYSQLLYSLLKEWEKKKECTFTIEHFREELGIPNTYDFKEVTRRVLKQVMKDLPQYFPNLKIEKILTRKKVTGLKFTWGREQREILDIKEAEVVEIEISEQLNKAIEKAKKNRFIAPLLTIDNIEILVEMFQEKDIIKGLNWSYKEIKQEIKSLNYLIKSIKTGMEQKEKKLVVKTVPEVVQEQEIKEEILKENNIDLEKDQEFKITEIEKIKITKDEYEELYKKFLQEQNAEHNLLTRKGFDIANKNKYEIVETEVEEKIYQFTIEELKEIPFEEFLGKKIEIVPAKDPTKKRYLTCNKDPDDENISFEVTEEIFHLDRIEQEKLLSKTGKLLTGGALYARLKKIAREQNIKIQYGDEIINGKEGK